MSKVADVVSVWENGQSFPHAWPVGLEKNSDSIGGMISKKWSYCDASCELLFEHTNYNQYSFEILSDETGFVVIDGIPGSPGKYAYILNGDATVRFVLTPAFNMRKFDPERLSIIQQNDEEDAKRRYKEVIPREQQVCFHSADTSGGKLEIFGDDGFGDCYYTYDWNTGELLLARALPLRS